MLICQSGVLRTAKAAYALDSQTVHDVVDRQAEISIREQISANNK